MPEFITLSTEAGEILVEIDEKRPVTRGKSVQEKVTQKMEGAMDAVRKVSQSMFSRIQDLHDKALKYYKDDAQLSKELYESYPENVTFKNGLAISYSKLAQFNRDKNEDRTTAHEYFTKAEKLWSELVLTAPKVIQFQKFLGMIKRDIEDLE